jgi:hypothetical protein
MDLPVSEQYRLVAKRWVEKDGAARLMEETKTSVLAKLISELEDMPYNRAEASVKASPEWREFLEQMVQMRTDALLLKCQMEYLRMRFSEQQSSEASRRAEMKL